MNETGLRVQSQNMVTSLEVLADAADLLPKNPSSVSRLDSANSVWTAEFEDQSRAIFKYFRRHSPNNDHFKSELSVYESNPTNEILPQVLLSDQNKRLIVFEYIDQVEPINFKIGSLLEKTTRSIRKLENNPQFQNSRPSFLNSWLDNDFKFGPAENIVLSAAKNCDTIVDSISRLVGDWSSDSQLHGDLKLTNFLFTSNQFYIIDWETVCFGPVEWDSAGLLQSLILEIVSKGPRLHWSTTQAQELIEILENANQKLIDAMTARLVQTSMEATQTALRVPVVAANILQAAEYISSRNFNFLAKI
jgi:hypothetical protein